MKKLLVYACLFIMVSCGSPSDDQANLPDGYLTQEEIVPVVAEMEMLQSIYNNKLIANEETKDSLAHYYNQIFNRYEVDPTLFDSSYAWHSGALDRSLSLQEAVVAFLKTLEEGRSAKQEN